MVFKWYLYTVAYLDRQYWLLLYINFIISGICAFFFPTCAKTNMWVYVMMSVLRHESSHGKAFYHRLDLRVSCLQHLSHWHNDRFCWASWFSRQFWQPYLKKVHAVLSELFSELYPIMVRACVVCMSKIKHFCDLSEFREIHNAFSNCRNFCYGLFLGAM